MYLTIAAIAASQTMRQRVAACVAQEGETQPENWAYVHAFRWAAAPGWDAKWESALAGAPDADPAANEAAITDADILAVVQQLRSTA